MENIILILSIFGGTIFSVIGWFILYCFRTREIATSTAGKHKALATDVEEMKKRYDAMPITLAEIQTDQKNFKEEVLRALGSLERAFTRQQRGD